MSFIGRLFGSSAATSEAVKAVRDGLDAVWHTKEEQAADRAADVTEARNVLLGWIKNSQGQNLARRVIALAISCSWLFLKFLGAGVSLAAIWADEPERIHASADAINVFAGDMTPAVMLILGFYFAAPHMSKVAEVALKRFGERNS